MPLSRSLRFPLWLGGLLVLAWALVDPRFRDVEGIATGLLCLPAAVGFAFLLIGGTVGGPWRRFGLWLALALVGQAVALQWIEAGNHVRYQHYRPIARLVTEPHPVLLLFLAAQVVLVGVGLRTRCGAMAAWMRRTLRPWQIAAVGLAFFLTSATVQENVGNYVVELFVAAFLQAVQVTTIVLAVWAVPSSAMDDLRRVFARLFGEGSGRNRLPLVAALWVTVFSATLNVVSYDRHPHVADEAAYLIHARYFADGVLTMPAPPARDAFDLYLMQFDGARWYPSPPPGWPAVLSLGTRVGAPWLVNPMLAGLNLLLISSLLGSLYGRRTARRAAVLLGLSPWYLFMGMNFMTHMVTLTCALLGAVAVQRARTSGQSGWAWLGGLAVGLGSLVRPLDGAITAGLLGLWSLGLGGKRLNVPAIAGLVLGAMVIGAAVLPYNQWLTGHPTEFPIMKYADERFGPGANALGFGPDRGMGWAIDPLPGHGPIDALINANLNASSLNTDLFGWGTGSLLLVALALFAGAVRREDLPMLGGMVAVFGVYFFYYFSGGPDFGARYWFIMIVPLLLFTVRGIAFLERATGDDGARVPLAVLSLCLLALVNFVPWRAIDKYHHYLGMRPDIRVLAKQHDFGKSVVLIRGTAHPDYASAAVYNPLDLRADAPIYAWYTSPEAAHEARGAYPDRPVWVLSGPTVTGAGYRIDEEPR